MNIPFRAAIDSKNRNPCRLAVMDFIVHPRDRMMVIATHGRGVYAIDVSQIKGR